MFIKKTRSKNFTYLSIVETYRDGGRVRHKTIAKLGRLDLLQKNGSLARLGESFQSFVPQSTIPKIKELTRLNWGAELIYRRIWNNFDLDRILDQSFASSKIEFDYKEENAKWDGFYAVQVSKKDMDREGVLNAYHSLWKIEESFRVMKHSLEIRPIYLSTAERVIGHIVLCFLAFVLHRNLELELLKEGLDHSVEKIRDAINGLEASILEVGRVKCAVHSPIKGLAKEILRILKVKVPKEAQLCSSF